MISNLFSLKYKLLNLFIYEYSSSHKSTPSTHRDIKIETSKFKSVENSMSQTCLKSENFPNKELVCLERFSYFVVIMY